MDGCIKKTWTANQRTSISHYETMHCIHILLHFRVGAVDGIAQTTGSALVTTTGQCSTPTVVNALYPIQTAYKWCQLIRAFGMQ